jgi:predicted PurR-regulated permease PerM
MSASIKPDPHCDETLDQRETLQARAVIANTEFKTRDVALVILTALAVLYTLYFAADIILPFVLALVLGLLLSPAARFLHTRLKFPRMLAALLLIGALFSALGGIGYGVSVPAHTWIAKAPQSVPELERKLGFLRRPIDLFQNGLQQMEGLMRQAGHADSRGGPDADTPNLESRGPASAPPTPGQTVTVQQSSGWGMSVLSGTRDFLSQVFTLVILLFFLLSDGDALLRRFVEILPGLPEKKRAVQIATAIERNISGYLATITLMNAFVGVANGISVWAFGLPDPLLWGLAAFMLNYIPILGALTGIAIFFFVGLFTFSNPLWALAPCGVYFLIHVMEGETITPMLLARRFTLNPLLVIAALMFWNWLWGIPGALLAVPLLAVTKIFCDNIETLTPIGHLLGAEQVRPKASR